MTKPVFPDSQELGLSLEPDAFVTTFGTIMIPPKFTGAGGDGIMSDYGPEDCIGGRERGKRCV